VEDVASSVGEQAYVWLVLRDAELVDPDWVVKGWMDSHGYVRTGDLVREKLSVISYVRWDYSYTEFSYLPLVMSGAELSATVEGAAPEQEPRVDEAPTPDEPAVPDQEQRVHVVQAGETLWEIAVQYGTTIQALVEANDIANPTLIRPGQKLIVP
jgi:LysM repeat protein